MADQNPDKKKHEDDQTKSPEKTDRGTSPPPPRTSSQSQTSHRGTSRPQTISQSQTSSRGTTSPPLHEAVGQSQTSHRGTSPLMFAMDQSPRHHATASVAESPSNSPRPKKINTGEFMTQNSPPSFVSFDEIMKAANGVTNMSLAHEIAVDNDFRFQKMEPPPNSLEKQVREIMNRAFWDVLDEKLREDPPDYGHAILLLQDVKENVQDLLLPHHNRLRAQIDEVLDLELISQQAEHQSLDIQYYAGYVMSLMAKLCAPIRDEEVAQLATISEVVPLFREIFRMLDVLKLDLANYNIEQIRPYIQQQSVEYERKKFQQLLEQQNDAGRDGLESTRAWLHRAGDCVSQQVAAALAATSGEHKSPSPAAMMNAAYMELLEWPENYVFPETLLLDEGRFRDLREKCQWLGLVASTLMVTYNLVGDPIAGVRAFKEKLKNHIAIIIEDVPFESVADVMPTAAELVLKEVQGCLSKHGYPPLVADRGEMLKRLVESVASPNQPVHKVLRKRLMDSIHQLLSGGGREIQIPSGFAAMAEEFSHVFGQFLRLVSHNRSVYGQIYADIISKYLEPKSTPASESAGEKS